MAVNCDIHGNITSCKHKLRRRHRNHRLHSHCPFGSFSKQSTKRTLGAYAFHKIQGSDMFTGKVFHSRRERVRRWFLARREIVPRVPEVDHKVTKKTNKDADDDGNLRLQDDEHMGSVRNRGRVGENIGNPPTHATPRHMARHTHHANFQVTEDEWDALSVHIEGPRITKQNPPPPLAVLRRAERKAMREISFKVHSGTPLKKAIKQMADYLFWQPEVPDRKKSAAGNGAAATCTAGSVPASAVQRQTTQSNRGTPKGKGKKGKNGVYGYDTWQFKGKGKKGKGHGNNTSSPYPPRQWQPPTWQPPTWQPPPTATRHRWRKHSAHQWNIAISRPATITATAFAQAAAGAPTSAQSKHKPRNTLRRGNHRPVTRAFPWVRLGQHVPR